MFGKKLEYFVENYGNAFFVGSLVSNKTVYVNKKACELFGITAETCDFEKIFTTSNARLREVIEQQVTSVRNTIIYNCTVTTGDGKQLFADLQTGFFNEEKTEIFMEMIFSTDISHKMAEFQIKKSPRAEAIMEYDAELTVGLTNTHFDALFNGSDKEFKVQFDHCFSNVFLPQNRASILEEIHQGLATNSQFSLKTQVLTLNEENKWLSIHFMKRKVDDSCGEKLMVTLTDIGIEVDLERSHHILQKQIAAMQDLTSDVLYYIDCEQGILYHNTEIVKAKDLVSPISNYVQSFIEREIVHPDYAEKYTTFLKNWYGNPSSVEECVIRAAIVSSDYQWYKIRGKKIFDNNGTLTHVLGALVNVQKEYELKEESNLLNQYFSVFQSISGESFYTVDVKRRTLLQTGQVAEELGLVSGQEVVDFPDCFFRNVHPDELESYKTFTLNSLNGISGSTEVRVRTIKGDYQWYGINCGIVRDEQGAVSEVVGRMHNIHKEKQLECENSTLNQYYQAVQALSEESIYIVDIHTKIMKSHGITESELGLPKIVYGYPESVKDLIFPEDLQSFLDFSAHTLDGTESHLTLRIQNRDRDYQWYELNSMIIRDDNGNPREVLGKIKNIQQQRDLEARASHDLMTQVLNKVSFEETAKDVIKNTLDGCSHVIIFIDLDDFKGINDTLGHNFGDFLLTTVGKRLKRVVREKDLIGRLGGDEFAVMLKSIGTAEAASLRVKLLLDTLQRPFSFEGKTVDIKASVGFAIYPQHGNDFTEVIKKADKALYHSKKLGKNVATMYSDAIV